MVYTKDEMPCEKQGRNKTWKRRHERAEVWGQPRNLNLWPLKYKQTVTRFVIQDPLFLLYPQQIFLSFYPHQILTRRAKISVNENNEEAAHVWWQGENKDETNIRGKDTEGRGDLYKATNDG